MTYNICPTGVVPRRISDGKQPDLFPETLASSQTMEQLAQQLSMSAKYPKYYKDVSNLREIDVYQVHQLFDVQDPSGALQHASKKLLLSGVRTGGKTKYDDIREARDTLNRWLEINQAKD
jgi:hypothetical protein